MYSSVFAFLVASCFVLSCDTKRSVYATSETPQPHTVRPYLPSPQLLTGPFATLAEVSATCLNKRCNTDDQRQVANLHAGFSIAAIVRDTQDFVVDGEEKPACHLALKYPSGWYLSKEVSDCYHGDDVSEDYIFAQNNSPTNTPDNSANHSSIEVTQTYGWSLLRIHWQREPYGPDSIPNQNTISSTHGFVCSGSQQPHPACIGPIILEVQIDATANEPMTCATSHQDTGIQASIAVNVSQSRVKVIPDSCLSSLRTTSHRFNELVALALSQPAEYILP